MIEFVCSRASDGQIGFMLACFARGMSRRTVPLDDAATEQSISRFSRLGGGGP